MVKLRLNHVLGKPKESLFTAAISSTSVFSHLATGAMHGKLLLPSGSQETLSHSAPSPNTEHTCCKSATVAEVQ